MEIDSATYIVEANKTKVKYYINGNENVIDAEPIPYCFIPTNFISRLSSHYNVQHTELRTIDTNQAVSKLTFPKPELVRAFRTRAERIGIPVYEADIRYVNRWMIDNNHTCSSYNIAYFDTEEDDSKSLPDPSTGNASILSIAVTYNNQTEFFSGDETDILTDFFIFLDENKISLLCGWNCSTWDVPFLIKRSHFNNLIFNKTKYRFLDLMLWYKYTTHSSRYSLEFVGEKILQKRKPFPEYKIALLTQAQLKQRNTWDAETTAEIDNKLNISKLAIQIAKMSNLFPDDVLHLKKDANAQASIMPTPSSVIDNFYLKQARKVGYVLPNKTENIRAKYPGAFIFNPNHGIYHNVLQYDIESLYPNIIIAFNYAPYGKTELLIPIIKGFLDGKKQAQNETEYWAYKLLANASYGILASRFTRLPTHEEAAKTAAKGKEIITSIIDFVQRLDYKVLYGDTDAIFVEGTIENKDIIQDLINDFIEKKFGVSNIKIRFEAFWSTIGFPRGAGNRDVKKRYFGIVKYDKKLNEANSVKMVGMENIRGDWCELAQRIQKDAIEMLLENKDKKEILNHIQTIVKGMYNHLYDDELVLVKHLNKEIKNYKVQPPHVKAYINAKQQGWVPSDILQYNVIRYYITKGNIPKITVLTKSHEIDYDYYYNRQIKPLLYRLNLVDDLKSDITEIKISKWFS